MENTESIVATEIISQNLPPEPQLSLPKEIEKYTVQGNDTPHIQTMTEYLGKYIQVLLTDNRLLTGRFRCFDKGKNIVLSECIEMRLVHPVLEPIQEPLEPQPEDEEKLKEWKNRQQYQELKYSDKKKGIERRIVGTILIGGNHIVRCHVGTSSSSSEN